MEEAYKILPKDQHPYWKIFAEEHREATVNYVSSVLGDKISEKEFVEDFCNLPGSKRPPKNGKYLYKTFIKYNWIKPV